MRVIFYWSTYLLDPGWSRTYSVQKAISMESKPCWFCEIEFLSVGIKYSYADFSSLLSSTWLIVSITLYANTTRYQFHYILNFSNTIVWNVRRFYLICYQLATLVFLLEKYFTEWCRDLHYDLITVDVEMSQSFFWNWFDIRFSMKSHMKTINKFQSIQNYPHEQARQQDLCNTQVLIIMLGTARKMRLWALNRNFSIIFPWTNMTALSSTIYWCNIH